MSDVSFEDLVATAKNSGAAADSGIAVVFYDFAQTPTSGTVGAKKTGLVIPANTIVDSGILRAETATTGGFDVQLVAAGDLIAAQTALASGTVVNVTRVDAGTSDREVTINVGSAATGQILVWFRLYPY